MQHNLEKEWKLVNTFLGKKHEKLTHGLNLTLKFSLVFTYRNFYLTRLSDPKLCILVYPSQWICVMIAMNFQTNLVDQIYCNEIFI